MATIECLPLDLVHEILSYLKLSCFFALKCTSSAFNAFLRFEDLPLARRVAYLQQADRFPRNRDLLACFHCCKMLPKDQFGLGQRKGNRRKFASTPTKDRFCLDCAAQKRLYGHMNPIVVHKNKESLYLCHKCGRYGTRTRLCSSQAAVSDQSLKAALQADSQEQDWVCWSKDAQQVPRLESLPLGVIDKIVSNLSYQDAIRLSSTCVRLQQVVDFAKVPIHDRFRFVCSKEASRPAFVDESSTKVCYACFRVRPADLFTQEQDYMVDMQGIVPFWQRRCRHCLYKMHANKNGPEALKDWNNRTMCDRCGLLKYKGSSCLGCLHSVDLMAHGIQPPEPCQHEDILVKWSQEHPKLEEQDVSHTADRFQSLWTEKAATRARREAREAMGHIQRLRKLKSALPSLQFRSVVRSSRNRVVEVQSG